MCISKVSHYDINWEDVVCYIYREHKDGTLAMARPCKACFNLIKTMGIKKVIYTTEGGWAQEVIQDTQNYQFVRSVPYA